MQMASLHSVLAMRDNHASPQPHVLASLLGAHSRLGSITDRLAQVLQVPPPGEQCPPLICIAFSGCVKTHFAGRLT